MATTLIVAANHSSNDVEYSESGADWVALAPASDYLVFSAGSNTVDDGEDIPTQSELNSAGVILTGAQQVVDRYFLADISANELKELFLMGNQDTQYVMAFDFDGATASEPVLELWDDENLDTVTGTTLGAGTPSNSWWKGITTTSSSAGSDWTGSTLAGSSDGNYLLLNDGSGAIAVATTLYCNLKIVVPASAATGINATPKFVVKYTSN
jgi:hypothetical protein